MEKNKQICQFENITNSPQGTVPPVDRTKSHDLGNFKRTEDKFDRTRGFDNELEQPRNPGMGGQN
jgi:hypothetical protein